jgi:hypothetical protein
MPDATPGFARTTGCPFPSVSTAAGLGSMRAASFAPLWLSAMSNLPSAVE